MGQEFYSDYKIELFTHLFICESLIFVHKWFPTIGQPGRLLEFCFNAVSAMQFP